MAGNRQVFDIIVIGGGIAGVGVALEAARQGYSVCLLEREQLLGAASSGSLRIMHGGFRYLLKGDLARAYRSLSDQHYLLSNHKERVLPLECLMPLKRFGLLSKWPARVGAITYNGLHRVAAGRSNSSAVINVSGGLVPLFGPGERCSLFWRDAVIQDLEGFHSDLRSELRRMGVELLEGIAARAIDQSGTIIEVKSDSLQLFGRAVVNTAGAWVRELQINLAETFKQRPIGWCKAFNVILRRRLEPHYGIGAFGFGGRAYFIVPRGEVSAVGTWYVPLEGLPRKPDVSSAEIKDFLHNFNTVPLEVDLTYKDVADVEMGILPMQKLGPNGPILWGSEIISGTSRYVEVVSTKYTTYRSQAQAVLKRLKGVLGEGIWGSDKERIS